MVNLMQGDCLIELPKLKDGLVDLTVTSPPYDNLRDYNGTCLWNESVWETALKEIFRVLKVGGVCVWVVCDAVIDGGETGSSFKQALSAIECGFLLHDTMIWKKSNPLPMNHRRYEQSFEYMFIFSKGKPAVFNPILENTTFPNKTTRYAYRNGTDKIHQRDCKSKANNQKIKENVWTFPNAKNGNGHPAVFPRKLAEDHILSWSNEGDVVIDPFMGSGTVGEACKKLNRDFIGIEKDENSFSIAAKKIDNASDLFSDLRESKEQQTNLFEQGA